MGVFKKNKTKQHNYMGRSLMRNKLMKKEISNNILYSKIGCDEEKNISKKFSILNKEPVDDYLDNQLVINDVEVTKVFVKKNEIKEKRNFLNKNKNANIQNIVLPIPGRAVFLKREDKINLIINERANTKIKKKKRKNVKKINFLMSGKNIIPINVRTPKNEESKKKKIKNLKKNIKKYNQIEGKNSKKNNNYSLENDNTILEENEDKNEENELKNEKIKNENEESVSENEESELENEESELENEENELENEESKLENEENELENEENELENEESELENEENELENEESENRQSKREIGKKKCGDDEIYSEDIEGNFFNKKSGYDKFKEEDRKLMNNLDMNKNNLNYDFKYVDMYEELGRKYREFNSQNNLNKEIIEKYEMEYFVEWRKLLSDIEEREGYIVTPYEKNIEYWKQLWRVIEKSHVLFYIIDARNPLFFYCKGLEYYVKKVDYRKKVIIILNKADFLNVEQRKLWADYFEERNVQFIFFSALRELYHQNKIVIENFSLMNSNKDEEKCHNLYKRENNFEKENFFESSKINIENDSISKNKNIIEKMTEEYIKKKKKNEDINDDKKNIINVGFGNLSYETKKNDSTDILSVDDLINLIKKTKLEIKNLYHEIEIETFTTPKYMVGFIGYPNVGKSSIINCLIGEKKVSVSRQPGKTKHFQTISLKSMHFSLCDCPGLIFPSLVFNKYDLIINGVFSIDHYKGNFIDIVQILCNLIPNQLCNYYKINNNIIREVKNEKQEKIFLLDATEFLHAFCTSRKYISGGKGGLLNYNFATRLIIHDFISGKLIYIFLPSYFMNSSNIYHNKKLLDDINSINQIEEELLKDRNTTEEIALTKRKFRQMQKKMIKGKNVMKYSIN
ncbi:large ribosomal subunit associated GTPase, putative [Plasmodium relictum]|uniref:Large ribosomal subunit associated GTPase, putative n=1 Tax=Plasmodium relictum TaxID=85471 RepID=A0A1J1HEK1_PLARL|nr:large ribosomal subunit associated GTPase, putative [Plasmodium relictum]CRH03839.1 large ribosomal subunit associated GTPase, putative [Plasmodium relictum]